MRPTTHLATAALLLLVSTTIAAQERATDPDTREVMAYRLTMPKLKQLNRVFVPREAATMLLAYFQAAFTAGLLESGTIKEIPKDANTENVKFLQANKAEIATLTALGEKDRDQERE